MEVVWPLSYEVLNVGTGTGTGSEGMTYDGKLLGCINLKEGLEDNTGGDAVEETEIAVAVGNDETGAP